MPRKFPFAFTNGIQASYLEVDTETGFIKLLQPLVVEDCGTIINPQLVDEQIRGGVVQGLGAALFEQCLYDEQRPAPERHHGRLPRADGGRDARHRGRPRRLADPGLRARRQGRRRGRHRRRRRRAVANAVNDALRPFGVEIAEIPITPERVLRALGRV